MYSMSDFAKKRKHILEIILGNICITLPYALLTVPHNIINGGTTSVALIFSNWTHIPVPILVDTLVILFLIIGFVGIGKDFFIKTFFSNICYMIFFHIFQYLPHNINFNLFLMSILAGIIVGTGYFFCLSNGASNGGFDVISLYLHEKDNRFDVAITLRYISWFILLIGIFTFGIKSVLLGLVFSFFQTETLKLLLTLNQTKTT